MRISEVFSNKKAAEGVVKFSKSSFTDPFIIKIIDLVAKARSVPTTTIVDEINEKIAKFKKLEAKAPILFSTVNDNVIESELFHMFEDLDIDVPGAPKFSKETMTLLRNRSRVEHHSKFFPLRSFVEKRRLENPNYMYVDDPDEEDGPKTKGRLSKYPTGTAPKARGDHPARGFEGITTACATPKGDFVFNVAFCQKLLDWAYLKGIKPSGVKYVNKGGKIPDEYAYIEFLLMHEWLHYSEADFYYHRIIPNANSKLINYVGDFRSNYLLVKSGYEQLPMGLFNDKINYDRQKTYKDMYDAVKSEFDKMKEPGDGNGKQPVKVGDTVRMPNGKKGTVTALKPDGTADVEEMV
jgi:hypothetical protein